MSHEVYSKFSSEGYFLPLVTSSFATLCSDISFLHSNTVKFGSQSCNWSTSPTTPQSWASLATCIILLNWDRRWKRCRGHQLPLNYTRAFIYSACGGNQAAPLHREVQGSHCPWGLGSRACPHSPTWGRLAWQLGMAGSRPTRQDRTEAMQDQGCGELAVSTAEALLGSMALWAGCEGHRCGCSRQSRLGISLRRTHRPVLWRKSCVRQHLCFQAFLNLKSGFILSLDLKSVCGLGGGGKST